MINRATKPDPTAIACVTAMLLLGVAAVCLMEWWVVL